ncbi:hypothetical protein Tco_0985074 [Tanacetum coccineum]
MVTLVDGVLENDSGCLNPPQEETSLEFLQDKRNLINSVQTFLGKFKRFSFYETPKVVSLAWETISEIEHAFKDKQYQPKGILELFRKLHDDVQNIHEEFAEYINTPNWNRPIVYYDDDDDEDYTIAITTFYSTHGIASPPDSEPVSLEVVEIVILEVGGIDTDILLTIKDDILRKKLFNVNLLIAKIESLKKSSGNPTSYLDLSLSDYEAFFCDSEPDSGNFTMDVVEDISDNLTRELYVHVLHDLPTHTTLQMD